MSDDTPSIEVTAVSDVDESATTDASRPVGPAANPETVGLPERLATADHIALESQFLMAGDSLLHKTDDGETNYIVFEVFDECDEQRYPNHVDGDAPGYQRAYVYSDDSEFDIWSADEIQARLNSGEWFHWRLLNRHFETVTTDEGTPVTFAAYAMAIETEFTREQDALALAFAWDTFEGVDGLTSPPDISNWCLYGTLSRMDADILNPSASEQAETRALADWFESYPAFRRAAESVLVSADHNAHVRLNISEPRVYRPENVYDGDGTPVDQSTHPVEDLLSEFNLDPDDVFGE